MIDTGPLVAYLDRADARHDAIAGMVGDFTGTLCTTSAVMTEAMHLLKGDTRGPRRLAEFVQAARIQVFESTQPEQLLSAVALIEQYADTPMDFADATLVLLSDRLGINQIITLDRRGFGIFRNRKGKAFQVMPAP